MRLRKLFSVVALVALGLGLVPSSGTVQAQATGPEYGAAVFMLGHPESTARDLQLMADARIGWARVNVPWRSIEPSCKNCIDWTELDRVVAASSAAGIKIMASVYHQPDWSRAVAAENGPPDDMFDYADFLQVLTTRYGPSSQRGRGTIHAIQVWNEPNLSREWGGARDMDPARCAPLPPAAPAALGAPAVAQPALPPECINRDQAAQYMYMLKESYTMVKAVDPAMLIVSAGLSPTGTNDGTAMPDDQYLSWMYEFGLAQYSDAIGMHAPGYGSAPEAELNSDERFPHPSFYFRRVEQLRDIMVLNGDQGKRAWILEFGWTTDQVNPQYSWYAVTPEQQADYIVRAFQYAATNWSGWVGPMFVWNMADPTWTPEYEQYWWSITDPNGTPRPAYTALQAARTDGRLP